MVSSLKTWPARLGLFVGVALGAAVVYAPALSALLAPGLLALAALTFLVQRLIRWPEGPAATQRVLVWTLVAFGSHLAFGLIVNNVDSLFELFSGDNVTYHEKALQLLAYWQDQGPGPALPPGREGFYYMLAGLYFLFGPHISAGLAINAGLGAALVPLLSDLTKRLFGTDAGRYVAPIVVLLPGMLVWTSLLLKEAAVLFLVAVSATFASRLNRRVHWSSLVGLALSITLLFTFRAPVALVMAAGFMAAVVAGMKQSVTGVATAFAFAMVLAGLVLILGVGYTGFLWSVGLDLERANVVRADLSTSASSGFDENVDISSGSAALSYLPEAVALFFLGPFPWMLQGSKQMLLLPDMIVWWLLLPSLVYGLRKGWAFVGRRTFVLLFAAMPTAVMLSLVVGNFGLLVRERMQILVLLIPFIAFGLSCWRNRHPESSNVISQV